MRTKPNKRPTLAERWPVLQSRWIPLAIVVVSITLIVGIHAG